MELPPTWLVRRGAARQTATGEGRLTCDLVADGVRVVRLRARLLPLAARWRGGRAPGGGDRAGFLPEERRAEADALDVGVATTSALELGVDISGLDAVVMAGLRDGCRRGSRPVGRAGRGRRPLLGCPGTTCGTLPSP